MNQEDRRVIGGVDAHADTHHAAVLDDRGQLLGTGSFEVSAAGYRELLAWLRSFGELDRVGVESTGSYAAGLTRHLLAASVEVLEVNQPHAHTRRRRGKTDAIDAEMAARHALSLSDPVTPKQTTGIVEAIRQLRVARESAVKSRSVAMLQLGDLIITAPSGLREQLATRKTLKGQAALCRRLRPDTDHLAEPVNAAKLALRSLARRIALPTRRSPSSIRVSRRWSRRPLRARPRYWASPPDTPASSWLPPDRTSTASAAKARSRRSAAPARRPSPPGNAGATA